MTHTIAGIKHNILTDSQWLQRAILALDSKGQLSDGDAKFFSSLAAGIKQYGSLTGPQVAAARKSVVKYAPQLLRFAQQRSAVVPAPVDPVVAQVPVVVDVQVPVVAGRVHRGPRGGYFHYSRSGVKVYHAV